MTELVTPQANCDPSDRVTNSLLGYGVIAGPVYVVVSLAQAFTRDGFDLSRHQWSLLANGTGGWIQVTNFIASGLMLLAMAVGVRRALGHGRGAKWAPRLIGVFGLSLITAAVFRADPALGFPAGTPEGAASVSVNGVVHFAAARDRVHLCRGGLLRARPSLHRRRPRQAGRGTPGPPASSSWRASPASPPEAAVPWRTCCSPPPCSWSSPGPQPFPWTSHGLPAAPPRPEPTDRTVRITKQHP